MQALVETLLVNVVAAAGMAALALALERSLRNPRLARAFWIAALAVLVLPLWRWLPGERSPETFGGVAAEGAWIVLGQATLVLIVAVGAGLYWAGLIVRWLRWRRLLLFAWLAPAEVQTAAARLAGELGLARRPAVYCAPFRISPALVTLGGRPQIVLPARLLERLTAEQADSLLAHELVHYAHRDHWLRPLEWLAAGLYWWCPLAWFISGRLRLAEECACDAVAARVTGAGPREYATAILETVEFLGVTTAPKLGRPDRTLHTRLVKVLEGPPIRRAPWSGLAAGSVCLLLMPVQGKLLELFPREAAWRGTAGREPWAANVSADRAIDAPVAEAELAASCAPRVLPSANRPPARHWATVPSPDGSCELLVSTGNRVQWRYGRTGAARELEGEALCAAFDPSGARFFLGGSNGRLEEYSSTTGRRTRTLAASGPTIRSVAAGHDLVAVSDGARRVGLFNESAAGEPCPLATQCQAAGCVRVTSDGRYLAVADGHWEAEVGRLELWDLQRSELLEVLAPPAPIGAVALVEAEGPPTILTLDWSGQALLWSEGVAEFVGWLPKEYVSVAAFAPIAPFRLHERGLFEWTAREGSSRQRPAHGVLVPH
jgi:Zn-dependent protease with chaperone function